MAGAGVALEAQPWEKGLSSFPDEEQKRQQEQSHQGGQPDW